MLAGGQPRKTHMKVIQGPSLFQLLQLLNCQREAKLFQICFVPAKANLLIKILFCSSKRKFTDLNCCFLAEANLQNSNLV